MHERVEAMNGTLRTQSEPGFGTEIVVSIPLQEALSLPVS
jgi:signal transduction histidine kinase